MLIKQRPFGVGGQKAAGPVRGNPMDVGLRRSSRNLRGELRGDWIFLFFARNPLKSPDSEK